MEWFSHYIYIYTCMTKRALDKVCDVTVREHVLIVWAFSFYDILQYKKYSKPWKTGIWNRVTFCGRLNVTCRRLYLLYSENLCACWCEISRLWLVSVALYAVNIWPSKILETETAVKSKECAVPEGVASIPCHSSCPLTGICKTSSFSCKFCDMPFLVNRTIRFSAEILNVNACFPFQNLALQEADSLTDTPTFSF